MTKKGLKRVLHPNIVAVVGASNTPGHVGYAVMKNLLSEKFKGKVIPVHLSSEDVQHIPAVSRIEDITEEIDLVILATPAATIPELLESCGKKQVGGVIIMSSGFTESGEDGKKLAGRVSEIIKQYAMTMIGPNCLGIIRPSIGLNASFTQKEVLPGNVAFISQSGALCSAILDWSFRENVGFSHFFSIGDMLDVGFADLIDYLGNDEQTTSILVYMESLADARRFMSAARATSRIKPIVVLKSGISAEGAKAALSHTGSLAGNDAVFTAAFKRAGILRVSTIGELFDCAQTLSAQSPPDGSRLLIITNAGGPGVIATDALMSLGGQLAQLEDETVAKLNEILPPNWSHGNPVDILGDADPQRYKQVLEVCLNDRHSDGILVLLTVQAMTDPTTIAQELVALPHINKKPVLASWMGEEELNSGRDILEKGKIPVYRVPENAVNSFMNMYRYGQNLELLYQTPAAIPHAFVPRTEANKQLIQDLQQQGKKLLVMHEVQQILENYGIPVAPCRLARTVDEAVALSTEIGFPVVMKIESSDISHKTDVGGVKLHVTSVEEVRAGYEDIIKNVTQAVPGAVIEGISLQHMISKKYELIIGSKKDPIFGPVIVFGMGGVAVEIYKDMNIGLPPLNMLLAKRLIEETKIYKLLNGYRNMPGVDIEAIQFLLYKFAYLIMDFPQIKEIDINPFVVDQEGGMVLDARIILEEVEESKKPYSHMVISPYPSQYVRELVLEKGKPVVLRPIRPEDELLEAEMFTRLSDETQRFRFFSLIRDITHEMLIKYTQIDYDREIAIIAEIDVNNDKKMAGVARLISDPYNDTAEFAIVVADPYQKQGLGSRMMDYILEIAKERGIGKIFAYFLDDNHTIRQMFEARHFVIAPREGFLHAELSLK